MTKLNRNSLEKISRELIRLLKANSANEVEKFLLEIGLARLLESGIINYARATQRTDLVIFLSYLAIENNFDISSSGVWLYIYESVKHSRQSDKILFTSITSIITNKIVSKDSASTTTLFNNKIYSIDVRDLELLLDFREYLAVLEYIRHLPKVSKDIKPWLGVTDTILNRSSFALESNEHAWYGKIFQVLIHNLKPFVVKTDLYINLKSVQANSLRLANDIDGAIKTYESIDKKYRTNLMLINMASCLCQVNQKLKAIVNLDTVIVNMINGIQQGEKPPLFFSTPAEDNYSKDGAITALKDIIAVGNASQAKIFLVSGTLLGLARVGDFLPHDKDLDFGIIGLDKHSEIINCALNSGKFQINPFYLSKSAPVQIALIHTPTGIWVDLFFYTEHEDHLTTGVDFQFGYRQYFKFSKFRLATVKFHDVDVFVPNNIDENLTENFGNWRVPDVSYISHLESPSTMDLGGLSHQLTARIWAIKALQAASMAKMLKVIATLDKYSDRPGGATKEVYDALCKYCMQKNMNIA